MTHKKRYYELDMARAIPMLFIPLVHVYEEFLMHGLAADGVWEQGLWLLYSCVLGASVFMISLGMNVVFTSHNSPKELAHRGLQTLLMFYLLNVVRYIIPGLIAVLCGDSEAWASSLRSSFCSDILFFAGAAFLFFALMRKLRLTPFQVLLVSVLMLTVDMLIPDPKFQSEYTDIAMGKFIYVNGWSCFPLLPWMAFPAAGYYLGHVIRMKDSTQDLSRFWGQVIMGCFVGLLAVGACLYNYGLDPFLIAAPTANSYITDFSTVVMDVLVAGIWYGSLYFLCHRISNPAILRLVSRFSDAILNFYCIHWIFVGWLEYMLLAAGFRNSYRFSMTHILLISIVILAMSVALSMCVKSSKKNKKYRKGIV